MKNKTFVLRVARGEKKRVCTFGVSGLGAAHAHIEICFGCGFAACPYVDFWAKVCGPGPGVGCRGMGPMGPMGPWAHGPMGSWAHGPHGPMGPMGPSGPIWPMWAHIGPMGPIWEVSPPTTHQMLGFFATCSNFVDYFRSIASFLTGICQTSNNMHNQIQSLCSNLI